MLRLVAARCQSRVRSACLAAPHSSALRASAAPSKYKNEAFPRLLSLDADTYRPPKAVNITSEEVWHRTVAPALRTFLALKKHLILPVAFVVPRDDDAWPRETWGYPLGKHAVWLRTCWRKGQPAPHFALRDLEEIDFAFDRSQYKWDHLIKPALRRYFELYGDTDVPQTFRIPTGDVAWPERLWGFSIGHRVFNIRHRGDFKAQIERDAAELEEIKFCYDSTTYDRDWRERVLSSLKVFRQEFGHCDVYRGFKVPDCPPWPKSAAGLPLGVIVNNIRIKKYYADQVARDDAELKEIEFVWDHAFAEWNDRIFAALKAFRQNHTDRHVPPRKFVVPSNDLWPEKAHGLKLGLAFTNIRSNSYYFDQFARTMDQLASLRLKVTITRAKWHQRVEPMLVTFEELHGHRDVPISFVVPSETPWNKSDWGIQLGRLKPKQRRWAGA
ncbi:hypothetical protein PF008_g22900 [Phytophthora fragariae]|uniref:Helicase-associated domain-containing protein n=1 Tax=Phytophthora fragariae TaxID=53985 RepID=A0A6G0QT09_9STRA|nr:hypothetical protein PF008_g22900 [Phytophthora fragariae]